MQELPDLQHGSETVFPGGEKPPPVTMVLNPHPNSNSNDEFKEVEESLTSPTDKPKITVVHSAADLVLAAAGGAEHIELRSHALFTTPLLAAQLSHASTQGIHFYVPPTVKSIRVRYLQKLRTLSHACM